MEADGAPVVEITTSATGRKKWSDFTHVQRFSLLPGGTLSVDNEVRLGDGVSDVPRIGVSLVLPAALESLTWFGRGPWENYSDRKASTLVGRYQSTVAEQYVPYIMPQENGHKTDVRWLTLTDGKGHGVRVSGAPTIEFSASHFTAGDLFQARHTYELAPRPEVYLNLDMAQRGLGTASCGPDTLPQYCLLESLYRFAYRLSAE